MPVTDLLPPDDLAAVRAIQIATAAQNLTAPAPAAPAPTITPAAPSVSIPSGGVSTAVSSLPPPTTAVTPPPAPTPPPAATPPPSPDDELAALSEQQLEAAIAEIEAQTELTREQLLADQSQVGSRYRLFLAQLKRARDERLRAVEFDAAERGILTSGIRAQAEAEALRQFAEERAAAEQQRAAEEQGIAAQLAALPQLQEQAIAQATAANQGITLDLETLRALLAGGLA